MNLAYSTTQAGLILGLAVLGSPGYVIQPWHQTLLTAALVSFCAFFNVFLAARLSILEALVLVLHVAGVFVIIIPLWVTAPRGNVQQTILEFTNGGGWSSDGLSYTIGTVPMIGMLIVCISVGAHRCTVQFTKQSYIAANSSRVTTVPYTWLRRPRMHQEPYHLSLYGPWPEMR
jgi:amino acid transporter